MNFYTLLPNGYANLIRAPAPSPPQPRNNTPLIQNFLAHALQISITNYATSLQQQIVNKRLAPSQALPNPEEKTPKKADSKRMEDRPDNSQIQKKIEKEIVSQKVSIQIDNTSKAKQNSVQSITNDQPSNSNHEGEQGDKKLDSIIKLKREKIRNKKDIRSLGLPNISMILTAQLPQPGLIHLHLRKKKQSLLRRRVTTWHQKMKNRRDKREIRMLNS